MEDPVVITIADGVATIRLNRPDRGNAIDARMAQALLEIVDRCDGDSGVRCLVLTGTGKLFCAGGDVQEFVAAGDGVSDLIATITTPLHQAIERLSVMPKPIITMINGAVAGAGLGLAMLGDISVAATSATFTSGYGALGVTPDAGVTWLLPKLVGLRAAQQILIVGKRIGAHEAKQIGLVTETVEGADLLQFTDALARRLKAQSGVAVMQTRALLRNGYRSELAEHLREEAEWIGKTAGSDNGREGTLAFVERRKPTFRA